MSEVILSPDEGPAKGTRFVIESYVRRESQAELTIPYDFPLEAGQSLLGALVKSRVYRYLLDIDGPWLVSFALSIVLCYLCCCLAIHLGYERHLAIGTAVVSWPLALLSCYFSTALVNFRLRYGRQWLKTVMGPTHLGLTPTGIKCYWKGKFFYNYPLLRSWPNVRLVNVQWQDRYDLQSQPHIFFSFAGRLTHCADLRLPLAGFRNRAHLEALLDYVYKYLPERSWGGELKEDGGRGFERTLAAFDESKQWEIELKA